MKDWTEWEVIRHRVSVGGVVTCEGKPVVTPLVEYASVADNALEDDSAPGDELGDEESLGYRFQPAGTKINGFFFVLDLIPGTYVLRFLNSAETKKGTQSIMKVPENEAEDTPMEWMNIDLTRSR